MSTPAKVSTAVADRLAALYKKNGTLTPALVVKDAKPKASPLHACFEWDDGVAAAKYREEQARELIRGVEVRITTEHTELRFPMYVRSPMAASAEQGYVTVESLRGDDVNARRALVYECDRLEAGLVRARHLAAGLGLAGKVDSLTAGLVELRAMASGE